MRWTLLLGLHGAGPDVAAAITPSTPVITLAITTLMGVERLLLRQASGRLQLAGMLLCSGSAAAMAFAKGPLLFGDAPDAAAASAAAAASSRGVAWMLLNALLAALVTIVNKEILRDFPLLSTAVFVEAFTVAWLTLAAAVASPAAAWRLDKYVVGAAVYSGLFATAMNNLFMARANKHCGPTTANLYMPLQPAMTAALDWLVLGDAVYLANLARAAPAARRTRGLPAPAVSRRTEAPAAGATPGVRPRCYCWASARASRQGRGERRRGCDGSGGRGRGRVAGGLRRRCRR